MTFSSDGTWCNCLSLWTEGQPGRPKLSLPCPYQRYQRVHRSRGREERERERERGREREIKVGELYKLKKTHTRNIML